jgi:hypothetical protein
MSWTDRRREKERQEKERQAVMSANLKTNSEDKEERREDKKEERKEKTETSRQWRIDKINALKEKFYAVALKRKWLVFLIGIGLIAYLVISSGGLSLGGIFDKIKGIF